MTKRKTPEEKTARKPRKRVAFSAPKDAATKAIVARNVSTSSFLRLPLEIRNKIYSELLGDRLIHLKYLNDDDLAESKRENRKTRSRAWSHVVCQADCPEDEQDQKTTYSDSGGDSEEVLWLRPHQKCDDSVDFLHWDRETLPLQILRSCRQMYTEANQVLWSTNTFSFDFGIAFKRFMETRTLIQKRELKKLRLQMDYMEEHKDWNSALNFAVIRSLHGLRHLRLRIEYSLESKDYEYLKNRFTGPYRTSYVKGLEKLATLPLTRVEVFVKNPYNTEGEDGYEDLWSEAERTEYTEGLRNLLLDPKGAEVYAQKQLEVKEIRRKYREFEAEMKASKAASYPIPFVLDHVDIHDPAIREQLIGALKATLSDSV